MMITQFKHDAVLQQGQLNIITMVLEEFLLQCSLFDMGH
jgi:hypothetical protein